MKIGDREIKKIIESFFYKRHYIAAANMIFTYPYPGKMYIRYLTKLGDYPYIVPIKTPIGSLQLVTYCQDDIRTINQIFCRKDYPMSNSEKVMVDFGSNIGISAAYFLSRNLSSEIYLFEPLPQNIQRLKKNLEPFIGRYHLEELAVAPVDGYVEFGWEDTGIYGGIGLKRDYSTHVACKDSNKVLEAILNKHGKIDILKIDIESLEKEVTERIPIQIACLIDKIYVEYTFKKNPLSHTHLLTPL